MPSRSPPSSFWERASARSSPACSPATSRSLRPASTRRRPWSWPTRPPLRSAERRLERLTGCEDEGVGVRAGGELERGRKAVLGRAAGKRENRPAQRAEGGGEPDDVLAEREVAEPGPRRDERHRRNEEQVGAPERLERALAVGLARLARRLCRFVGHGEAALDLRPHVDAVEVAVLGEEVTVNVGDLALERGREEVREREVDPTSSWEERGRRLDALADQRLGVVRPGDCDGDLLER